MLYLTFEHKFEVSNEGNNEAAPTAQTHQQGLEMYVRTLRIKCHINQ